MNLDVVNSFALLLPMLAGLALIDSLSFGTLAIPVWLLMAPGRVRIGRVLLYLGTISGFYFAVGLVLLFGARAVTQHLDIDWSNPTLMLLGFLLGLGLLILSFIIEPPKAATPAQHSKQPTVLAGAYARLASWRAAAVGEHSKNVNSTPGRGDTAQRVPRGQASLVGIAITAGLLEVATMLPYLAAIGLLTTSAPVLGLVPMQSVGLLGAYCVVMLLPALFLLFGRSLLHSLITPLLVSIDSWFARNGQSTASWIAGIIGVLLMINTWSAVQEFLLG